jgi:hypothetical protein
VGQPPGPRQFWCGIAVDVAKLGDASPMFVPACEPVNFSILAIGPSSIRGLMVRRRAQRAVSNHRGRFGLAAILRDALASLGLLRMRSVKDSRLLRGDERRMLLCPSLHIPLSHFQWTQSRCGPAFSPSQNRQGFADQRLVASLSRASRTRERGNIQTPSSLFSIGSNAIVARAATLCIGDHHDE